MRLRLETRLGSVATQGVAVITVNAPPENIALSGTHTLAEDAALGTAVGTLSATDPEGEAVTFEVIGAAASMFDVSGTSLRLIGVLDYETASSHSVTVRATDADDEFADQDFTITVTDVSESAGDVGSSDGDVVTDDTGNFDVPPTVVDVDDGIKFSGKKKSNGSTGKFIFDIGTLLANHKFTMTYDPDFTLLGNLGVTAMVGFGLKQANDFRISGLKGDGNTGLKAYEISGDNKWNQTSGFTTTDGGAAQHGTQAGPNWLQFEVSEDGATYTLRTSADGEAWVDEFTDVVPAPLDEATDATTFGIAVFLDADDAGPFSVLISLWEAAAVVRREVMLYSGHSIYDVVEHDSREVALAGADVVMRGG